MPIDETLPPPGKRPVTKKIVATALAFFAAFVLLAISYVIQPPPAWFFALNLAAAVFALCAVIGALWIARDLYKPWGKRTSTRGG